ncbi:hypothetical protein MSAR_40090 [Mycolicibacterium sarraceniae]|uniref:Uncharacterized protein n=1 Tax=Mycolicibacterium sarraceniae TaxID=1534348 RepID=A0A7I7SVY0_9MYCO|nr:hypothetical protein MSAR_40090 [Mycolicibacterium sarraceniae]
MTIQPSCSRATCTITGEAAGADLKNPMAGMISKKNALRAVRDARPTGTAAPV